MGSVAVSPCVLDMGRIGDAEQRRSAELQELRGSAYASQQEQWR